MAVESRDTRLLPEVARPWVDALSERFGPCVESRLIEAARPLVDQYLEDVESRPKIGRRPESLRRPRRVCTRLPLVAIRGTGSDRRPTPVQSRGSYGGVTRWSDRSSSLRK